MRLRLVLCVILAASAALAQTPTLTDAEKKFQDSMNNVALEGYFTMGDGGDLKKDRYVIERVTKLKDDTWNFEANIKMAGREMKITLPIPVKFAGDTPVITLTNFSMMGQGPFSARIVFYEGQYAGTWSHGDKGSGLMFGKIVKNDAAPAK